MPSDTLHVLLVEDGRTVHPIRTALDSMHPPIDLDCCTTLADACARASGGSYDAVLLDLDLPDSAGLPTLRRLAAEAPQVPVIVLTGAEDDEAAAAAVQNGAQDYLVRSDADARTLARSLRYAIDRAVFQAELIRRERYFRALIEHSYDIVVLLGPDGTFLYQSPATERVLGYTPAELDGQSVLSLIHPEDQHRAASLLGAWPGAFAKDDVFNFRLKHKDGGWRVMEALGRPLDDDPRKGIIVNARDVSDRVRSEETLRLTEARLRQVHKMEAVGRLAGGIAHDFNNVLTAIYGYSDLLMESLEAGDPRREDVEEIRRSAERAAALTRQLLAFSRQQMLQPQTLDLNAVVGALHSMLARLVGTDVQTTFEPGPGLWPVRADKGQIEQVLLNLAGNARDAMPEGGSLHIRLENRTIGEDAARDLPGLLPGDYVALSVADTGVGMPEHVRRHIFEPFFTTKEQGLGTGLGLATVYGVVKQSGGGIYVESQEQKGTTFTIYLPPHREPTTSA